MLKRRCFAFSVLVCLWIFLLVCCGCEISTLPPKQLSAADLVFSLEANVEIQSVGQEYHGKLQYHPSQVASLTLDSPEELKSLTWFWQGDHFQITYQGLSVQSKDCPLPDSSFAALLIRVLNYAQQPAALTACGDHTFEGVSDGVPFTITAGADGRIQKVEIPEFDFVASFTDPQSEILKNAGS